MQLGKQNPSASTGSINSTGMVETFLLHIPKNQIV